MSRLLTVAEEYALRLLQPKYTQADAKRIAHDLVHNYPEHGFVIDVAECKRLGLKVEEPPADLTAIMETVWLKTANMNLVGLVREDR